MVVPLLSPETTAYRLPSARNPVIDRAYVELHPVPPPRIARLLCLFGIEPQIRAWGKVLRRMRLAWLMCFIFLAGHAISFAGDVVATEDTNLDVGRRIAATLSSNNPVTYSFTGRADTSYLLEVTQQSLDFVVAVIDPAGIRRIFNSPLEHDGSDYVLLPSGSPGSYRITVESRDLSHAEGTYSILLSELSGDSQDNFALFQAWRLMTSAAALNADADEAKIDETAIEDAVSTLKKKAEENYRKASRRWEKLGNRKHQAYALYCSAMIRYWELFDWKQSADDANRAADLFLDLGDRYLHAHAKFLHAAALVELAGEPGTPDPDSLFETALEEFDRTYAIHGETGGSSELAQVLNFIGYTHHLRGNLEDAQANWQRSSVLYHDAGEWRDELLVQQNLAVIDIDEGYFGKAIEKFEYIISQIPNDVSPNLEALVFDNLGAAHRELGNIDEALEAYSRSLALRTQLDDAAHVGVPLRGLGSTYYASGEFERAKYYLEQALEATRKTEDGRSQAAILTYLGNIAYLESDYTAALELHQGATEITQSRQDEAVRSTLIARDLVAMRRFDEATRLMTDLFESAVDSPKILADAYVQIGRSQIGRNNYDAATKSLEKALSIYKSLNLREGEVDAYHALAMAMRQTGNLQQAIAYGEEALVLIDSLRLNVSSPDLRAFYLARRRNYFESQIDLLMNATVGSEADAKRKGILSALNISERSRARMLVDLLSETRTSYYQDNIDSELMLRRAALYEDLAARRYQRDRLIRNQETTGVAAERLQRLLIEMASLENELTLLDAELSTKSQLSARVLTGQEIQNSVEHNSTLLQYELGEDRSYVWIVSSDSIQAVELPDRKVIESTARDAFEALSHTGTGSPQERTDSPLRALSDLILAPVLPFLSRQKILVAADGALHYIPFGVLPVKLEGRVTPLIASKQVVVIPSMSVLVAQRERQSGVPPLKTVALFADPVFSHTDKRLDPSTQEDTEPSGEQRDIVVRSSVREQLQRLTYTGHEAKEIAALVPSEEKMIAVGFHANLNKVLSTDLTQYRYVHFATHGLIDSRYPALSALALSQFDSDGNKQPGFLRLDDIYALRLNADVVVLSACETALGREIQGEGLVGMTQGFLVAGARSLILSLWQVPDRATAALMVDLYDGLISDGLPPGQALREAQLMIASDRRWEDPYFWGAFVVLGDVR